MAYREIRKLEHRVIRELHDPKIQMLDVSILSKVDVDQFYGIEMDEFSSRIAETALWMVDHIMNVELGGMYGQAYARIPLKKHPNIANADALEMVSLERRSSGIRVLIRSGKPAVWRRKKIQ